MQGTEAKIVRYVRDHAGATPDELAERLGVTTRTLRTYVHRANDALAGCALLELQKGGYALTVNNEEQLNELLKSTQATSIDRNDPRERVACLLNDLLMRADWVTLEELSQELHTSRSTISGDLKLVREQISPFDLEVETRARYGLRVVGSELNRRICLASNTVENYARLFDLADHADLSAYDAAPIDGPVAMERIARCVDEALAEADFSISALAYQNLLVHLGIALIRIGGGNYVPVPTEELERLADSREMATARILAEKIERALDVELPEQEVAYVAIHLASKRAIERAAFALDRANGTAAPVEGGPMLDAAVVPAASPQEPAPDLVISDDVWHAVDGMVERVWQIFRYDFRDDLELRMNLACHVAPLAVRLRYHMSMDNPLLQEIRTRYPLAYSMAVESASVLAEVYGQTLSDDEIGYIAMTFGLALERSKSGRSKKRILVVCASGVGSAQMLEHLYRQQFGDCLESVESCDVARIDRVDFSRIDYVFTTVPLSSPLPVPVREVGFFPTGDEVARIRALLTGKNIGASDVPVRFATRFPQELFLVRPACATKDELLDMMCERMQATGLVAPNMRELVNEREAAAPTAFGNGVAMPHPMHPVTERAFGAVAVLKDPIDWGGHEVRVVFLMALSREEPQELKNLFARLSEFVMDKEGVGRLVANPTWGELCCLLEGEKRRGHADEDTGSAAGASSTAVAGTEFAPAANGPITSTT